MFFYKGDSSTFISIYTLILYSWVVLLYMLVFWNELYTGQDRVVHVLGRAVYVRVRIGSCKDELYTGEYGDSFLTQFLVDKLFELIRTI